MVERDVSHRGAPCAACGYRNRPGSNLCNLCGGYLYDRVPAPVDPRAGTGPVPVPPPLPAAPPPPPVRRVPVAISLDGEADIYAAPKTAQASLSLEPEATPAEPEPPAAVEVEREPAAALGSAPVPTAPPLRASAPPLRAAPAPAALPVRTASAPPRKFPLEPAGDDLSSDVFQERLRREQATRRAWKAVGIAFVASTALGVPGSLQPLSLLLNATGAVLYGFPVGYVACRQRLGMLGGGLLGAVAGALYAGPLILLFALFLPGGGAAWATQIVRGALAGLLPGAWAGRRAPR